MVKSELRGTYITGRKDADGKPLPPLLVREQGHTYLKKEPTTTADHEAIGMAQLRQHSRRLKRLTLQRKNAMTTRTEG